MRFKVGDIIMPKERDGPDKWYDIVYKIVKIYDDHTVELEVIPRGGSFEDIAEDVEKDVDVSLESWPLWVSVEFEVDIEKKVIDVTFDEDEWVLVE